MKHLCLFLTLMTFTNGLYAQECSDEQVVASLICTTTNAPDIRFYLNEFQTCQNGKITDLERSMMGMNVLSQTSVDDIHTIDAESISIEFADKRVLIDAESRVDYLSFLMPTSITMLDGDSTIEMKVTSILEPDYEGSDRFHFAGSYKLKTKKHLTEGKLFCFVYR